ncbi:hypothetical protein ACFL3N_01495 [Candidatus Omnitrophota bacterium]
MRKLISSLAVFLSATTLSFAESPITGQEYLDLSGRRRIEVVSAYRQRALKDSVIIRDSPAYYCQMLDKFYEKHPDHKKESMDIILKTLIIMRYGLARERSRPRQPRPGMARRGIICRADRARLERRKR